MAVSKSKREIISTTLSFLQSLCGSGKTANLDCTMATELPSSEEEVHALLQEAVSSRASHIKKQAETITMANVRRLLESDLGLEKSALDVHKSFIRQLVDMVLLSSEGQEEEEEAIVSEEASKPSKKRSAKKAREGNGSADQTDEKNFEETNHVEAPKKKKQKAKEEKFSSKEEDDEDSGEGHAELSEEEVPPKEKKQKVKTRKEDEEIKEMNENGDGSHSEMSEEDSDVSEMKKAKKVSLKTASVKPVQNKKVEHLKKIIKACGLTIPPLVYKRVKQQPEDKQDKFLIKELEDILSRQGLSSDPSEKEIKAAKRKIAREKDLEGIDTTNIIMEPRGRRATSQLFAPVYNPPPVEYDSEQDEEGEEDDEEDSDNAVEGSEDEEKDVAVADDSDNSD